LLVGVMNVTGVTLLDTSVAGKGCANYFLRSQYLKVHIASLWRPVSYSGLLAGEVERTVVFGAQLAGQAIERSIAKSKRGTIPPLIRAAAEGIVPCANKLGCLC
jgi:hypothetical protein